MLCYKMSLRGHEGFETQNFQNASIELKHDWKYACGILTMIKHMLLYKMSLRGHKRGSKVNIFKMLQLSWNLTKSQKTFMAS